jgi:hypothetical protein
MRDDAADFIGGIPQRYEPVFVPRGARTPMGGHAEAGKFPRNPGG